MTAKSFKKWTIGSTLGVFLAGFLGVGAACLAGEPEAAGAVAETAAKAVDPSLYYAICITMLGGSLAAALAVGKVGSAAMGAAAEKPEILGKAIAFVGLGEGIALFSFLISLFLVFKI